MLSPRELQTSSFELRNLKFQFKEPGKSSRYTDPSLRLLEDTLRHPLLPRSARMDWSRGRVYRESWLRLDSFAAAEGESQSESATFPASADSPRYEPQVSESAAGLLLL